MPHRRSADLTTDLKKEAAGSDGIFSLYSSFIRRLRAPGESSMNKIVYSTFSR